MDAGAFLYKAVADDIAAMIDAGTLATGERVPSVRRLSRQRRISISTVLQAYQLLETRGLIQARPQSGYYVRASRAAAAEPAMSRPPKTPRPVDVQAIVSRVIEDRCWTQPVPFGTSVPDPRLLPLAKLRRILATISRREPAAIGSYSFPPGNPKLRRHIALRMRDWGVRVDADEVIVTNGCMEAVNLCLRAVAKPGDVIALESPTYFGLLQIIETLGMKALEIPTHPREGISLEALQLALEREKVAACLLMPTVSNPLGATMTEAAKRRLVRLLAAHDIPLIEDCIYSDLAFGARRPFAAKAYDRKGTVMLCSSFSKTFAPGFRIGWALAGRHAQRVQMLKFVSSVGTSELFQLAAAEFVAQGGYDRLLRRLRRTYASHIETVSQSVSRHFPPGTRVARPTGGFVLWVEMPERVDSLLLYEAALKEGIGLAPGPMFSSSGRYRNCLRFNCALPWRAEFERAIARVGALARELTGR